MFPTVAGAIVPIYNIKEITTGLVLDGPSLAEERKGQHGGDGRAWGYVR